MAERDLRLTTHTYARTQQLKKKIFTLKTENIKESIGIQTSFHMKFKSQKVHLSQYITIFRATDSSNLNRC